MNRSTIAVVLLFAAVIIGAVIYVQYQRYRTPLTQEDLSRVDHSNAEARIADNVKTAFNLPETSSRTPSNDLKITNGVAHSIPLREIVSGGPPKDGIPSIDDPVFESPTQADFYLDDKGAGLAVEVDGVHRFYPYQILVWHEIVNDEINGQPLLITFCPLCYTGITFIPEVEGEIVEFGTSGLLRNNNLLMYDRASGSLWSQALGEAVVGERTGTRLEHYPALTMNWEDWRDAHPDGEVLSRETGTVRDYTHDPYVNYYDSPVINFPLSHTDERLQAKAVVFGIRSGSQTKAYPREVIEEEVLIQEELEQSAPLVLFDEERSVVRIFDRITNDGLQTFELDNGALVDKETESVWNFEGEAVSGTLEGTELTPIPYDTSFWFSWAASYPDTELYSQN